MVKYFNIKTGDIIKFTNPRIEKRGKHQFYNSNTGQYFTTTSFSIKGLLGVYPYANGLVKKRFIASVSGPISGWGSGGNLHSSISLYLLDNYKPEIMGSGYKVNLIAQKELHDFKKVSRELDLNLIPTKVKSSFYSNQISTSYTQEKLNKLNKTTEEKVKYLRKNFFMLAGIPTYIQVAFSMVAGNHCSHCGTGFLQPGVQLINLEDTKEKDSISQKASLRLIDTGVRNGDEAYVFPIAYKCVSCKQFNFVFKTSKRSFNSKYSDSLSSIVRITTLNLEEKEVASLNKAIMVWEKR